MLSSANPRTLRAWNTRWPAVALLAFLAALPGQARPRVAPGIPRAPAAAYGFAELHPAWLLGSYWVGRPWPWGWYRATPATWSVEGLASGAAITEAVNGALAQRQPAIEVPGTSSWLNFASVEALPNGRISFYFRKAGVVQRGVGECQLGLLNGRPASGLGAHMLNAACVVAYGRGA
jgi:hypothetical protein